MRTEAIGGTHLCHNPSDNPGTTLGKDLNPALLNQGSPTALTNTVRRPKSPRRNIDSLFLEQIGQSQAITMNNNSNFQKAMDVKRSSSSSPSRTRANLYRNLNVTHELRRSRSQIGKMETSFSTTGPVGDRYASTTAPNSQQQQQQQQQRDLAPIRQREPSPTRQNGCNPNVEDLLRRVRAIQSKASGLKSGSVGQCQDGPRRALGYAKEKAPIVTRQTRGCVRDFVDTTAIIVREECGNQGFHGDDGQFFMDVEDKEEDPKGPDPEIKPHDASQQWTMLDESTTMQSPEEKKRSSKANNTSFSSISQQSANQIAEQVSDNLRSARGAVRYPEAKHAMERPPIGSPGNDGRGHGGMVLERTFVPPREIVTPSPPPQRPMSPTSQEGSVDMLNPIGATKGEDHFSMREYRLQMFQTDIKDDGSKKKKNNVTKSQLSRALGELEMQDKTINDLQTKLEQTEESLRNLEDANPGLSKRSSSSKTKKERERDEKKAKKEAKYKKRIIELEQDLARLRKRLQVAQMEAEGRDRKTREEIQDLQARLEIEQAKARVNHQTRSPNLDRRADSAVVISLRAEIISLKSQLEDANALVHEAERKASADPPASGSPNRGTIIKLKSKLARTEAELRELKKVFNNRNDKSNSASDSERLHLLEQLGHVEYALNKAKNKADNDLNKAKASEKQALAELEKVRESCHKLQIKHLKVSEERTQKEKELDQSRNETTALKLKIEKLNAQASEAKQAETATRIMSSENLEKTRKLEDELKLTKKREEGLKKIVASLTERIYKAEIDSKRVQDLTKELEVLKKSSKERIPDDERTQERLARETRLLDEITSLKSRLAETDNLAEKIKSDAVAEIGDIRESESALRTEVSDLKSQLATAKKDKEKLQTSKATPNIPPDVSREIDELKARLQETKEKYREERLRSASERIERRRKDDEMKGEIKLLKLQLAENGTEIEPDAVWTAEVEILKARLDKSEEEMEYLRKKSASDRQKKRVAMAKLQQDLTRSMARLESVHGEKPGRESNPTDNSGFGVDLSFGSSSGGASTPNQSFLSAASSQGPTTPRKTSFSVSDASSSSTATPVVASPDPFAFTPGVRARSSKDLSSPWKNSTAKKQQPSNSKYISEAFDPYGD